MRTARRHALLTLVTLSASVLSITLAGARPLPGVGRHGAVIVQMPPRNAAPVLIDVTPRKTTVVVDGEEAGKARDFDSRAYPLWLSRGTHVIELRHKGYQTLRLKLDARPRKAYRMRYDLREGNGLDPRSWKGSDAAKPDDGENTI